MNQDDIKGGLSALAGPVVSGIADIGLAALGRSWSNHDWLSKTGALHALAVDDQINGPRRTIQGLKQAGLNPALANQGQFSPLSMQSAPMASNPMKLNPIDLIQLRLTDAQAKNIDADTRNKNIEIKRKIDADNSANAQFRGQLEYWLNNEPQDSDKYLAAEWLMAQDDVFSTGSLEGSQRAMEWKEAYARTTANALGHEFAEQVTKEKLKGNVPEVLAQMDKWQLSKLGAELAEIQTRTLALGIGMDVDRANIQKLVAETANIIEDTGLKHYSSFAKLASSGEGLAAAFVFLQDAMHTTAGLLPVAGMGALGRLGRGFSAPTTQKAFNGLTRFDYNSSVKPKL